MRRWLTVGCLILVCLQIQGVNAKESLTKRQDVQAFVKEMVSKYHFDAKELNTVLESAEYQPKIIESMERPYEKKTWDVYRDLFLTEKRVREGLAFWQANQETLKKAEEKYGVPPHIIVAILGVETLYGKHQGRYRVLDSLTTLAFHYPKRAEFFKKELREYLLLCREQGVSPTEYLGSYAGAIGKPQFMPSSYRFYAVDFSGEGRRDLVKEDRDVIGSVANYFHRHGWKLGDDVVEPAEVKQGKVASLTKNARRAEYETSKLLASGINLSQQKTKQGRPEKAGLIELQTKAGQEYWLAYPNFYVITRYNTSPQYALVVYLLSQQLSEQFQQKASHA